MIVPPLTGWVSVSVWFGKGNLLSPDVPINTVLLVCMFISREYDLFPLMVGLYFPVVFQSIANLFTKRSG